MELVRDVLDKQIVDRASDRLGKVDGLIMTITEGEPPRVTALSVGPVTLAGRLSSRLASLVERMLRACDAGAGATRFAIAQVTKVDIEVRVDVLADDTPARDVEHWLRDHVVGRIPGSGVKG